MAVMIECTSCKNSKYPGEFRNEEFLVCDNCLPEGQNLMSLNEAKTYVSLLLEKQDIEVNEFKYLMEAFDKIKHEPGKFWCHGVAKTQEIFSVYIPHVSGSAGR